ncbi:MAG: L-serine ammonia-lyase, partial [Actinobacteria bacterium]|nr:L-serine ammonia-lyase [Actinomycetota bacterium]
MALSVFDLFRVGIGPSSSHTVGPMKAAGRFVAALSADGLLGQVAGVKAELFGSLGATGHGHGSVAAVVLGLAGQDPETVDPPAVRPMVQSCRDSGQLKLAGDKVIAFNPDTDVVLHRRRSL